MKRRLLYLLPLIAVLIALVSAVAPLGVNADPPTDGPRAILTLKNTDAPNSYTVKGTLGASTNITFHYDSDKKVWFSDKIPGGGGGGSCTVQITATLTLHVAVTIGGKSAGNAPTFNFCNGGSNIQNKSVTVVSADKATDPTTFSGKVTYKDDDGHSQPVQSEASGSLKSDSSNYPLIFDDTGNIKKINVAPGSYTLKVDYAVPGGQNQNYTQNITIKSGQDYVLSNAIAGNVANDNGNGIDPNSPEANGGAGADANNDSTPSCEASGFSLSWIFCPLINGLADATDAVYSKIVQPLLKTSPIELSKPADDPTHTYAIWSNFRIYGDVFLVIALLVVVFGQSIGGGAIDAYTAKKVLPRLVIAAILINISIYLVAIAVDISNIVGNGISDLIEAPFKSAGKAFQLNISGGTGDLGMAALVGGGIWAVAALGPLLEFLLLFFLIPAFLTFLAILVTVLVRQGLIILLILVSPVAFALYCLPNTEQYFRKWWELLVQTLMVYPIIAALFAIANVLSVTIDSTTSGITKNLADLVSIIALFVPLFLIPYSFRIAGGVLGRLHEVATNYGKRGSEALKGNANNPDSWRNRSRSKLAQRNAELGVDGAGMKTRLLKPPDPRDGRAAWSNYRGRIQSRRQATRTNLGQSFFENDSVAKANKGNDQFYLAVANRKMASKMRQDLVKEDAARVARGETAKNGADISSWQNAINAADLVPKTPGIQMQAALQHAGTGFQYAYGQQGYNQLAETMSGVTGASLARDAAGNVTGATGNRAGAYADAMDNAQFGLKGAGRYDLAGINRGAGYSFEAGMKKSSGYTAGQGKPETYVAGAERYLGSNIVDAKGNTPAAPVLSQQLHSNLLNGSTSSQDVGKWHARLLDAQQGATVANKDEINKQIQAIEGVTQSPTTPRNQAEADMMNDLGVSIARNRAQMRMGTLDPDLMDN